MEIRELLIVVWPLLVFQFFLMVAALISMARSGETKLLPKVAWVIIVIVVATIGPIFYFILGKGEKRDNEQYRD